MNEPEERVRRGERALEDARRRFTWPAIAERLDRVLSEAAEREMVFHRSPLVDVLIGSDD